MDSTKSSAARQGPTLTRTTFESSRLLEFCSEKELINQTGHDTTEWPLVILKETVDNALDACEEVAVAPVVTINVDAKGITISDNGPGIPLKTIDGILNYAIRVSSREAYMAPDRGAQGNALKTLVAMPYVLSDGDGRGEVTITTSEGKNEIVFSVDPIRQQPRIQRAIRPADVKTGTTFSIRWPDVASEILTYAKDDFLQLARDFVFLNPHLTLSVDWFGEKWSREATNPGWEKWKPQMPTSPHWYTPKDFERLLAAYIAHDQDRGADRYVRDVVKEFRGLSGTAKQKAVLDATGTARTMLSDLASDDGIDHAVAAKLLTTMKAQSKEVKPTALGAIGKDHLRERFIEAGCDKQTFRYTKIYDVENGVPCIVESAFALFADEHRTRTVITGVNWSGAIGNPFRSLGTGYGDGLTALLERQMAGRREPVLFLLHCACPRVRYTDRGKTNIAIS